MESQVFAPGIISLPDRYDQDVVWSPDGLELLFQEMDDVWDGKQLWYTHAKEGQWTELIPITDVHALPEDSFFYSPRGGTLSTDGKTLYFIQNHSIWKMQRTEQGWTEPVDLQVALISNYDVWDLSATNDGTFYIVMANPTTYTSYLYRAQHINGAYQPLENLTSRFGYIRGFYVIVAPDESYIITSMYDAPGGMGGDDLWIRLNYGQDNWSSRINLGSKVNSSREDIAPNISRDGQYLFFARRGPWPGNVQYAESYWIEARAVLPVPDGPIENLSTGLRFGSIQTAINYANNGDEIVLACGIYEESIDLMDKDITLRSEDPNNPFYIGSTIIQGNNDNPAVTLQDNSQACEIAGLTIRAGSIGIKGTATNAIIRNCRIMDNTNHGLELSQASSPSLQHCLITSNGQTGITMLADSGRNNNCKPNIENCIIVDNGQANIVGGEPIIVDSIID
jgi:hypothetical protein